MKVGVPRGLVGTGLALGVVLLAELLATALSPAQFTVVVVANAVSSLPFIAILVAGGYWLGHSEIDTDRYRRIAAWVLAGFAFLTGFFALIAVFTQDSWLARIGILRWAVAAGAGSGLLVGLFEARAIDRAVTAERTRVRNEELQRRNERLDDLASIIAHDLRNPLNVAGGHLELVRADSDDDRLDEVATAFDRMEEIIEETLTLARSGRVIDEPEPVDLADVATECWHNVATVRATVEIEDSARITADPDRLRHLFENLFRNAIEHGGPDVTVRVGHMDGGFYVADDGPGVPEDERDGVFDAGYSTTESGSGFGLAIVKQIVEAHGWAVRVTDSADGGARFEITGVETDAPPATGSTLTAAGTP